MWRAFKRMCTVLGFMMIMISVLSMIITSAAMRQAAPQLPDEFVIYFPLENGFIEHHTEVSPYEFKSRGMTIRDAVDALEEAAYDPRVKGFVTSIKGGNVSLSHIVELREAIKKFRDAGKFAYIYATSYNAFTSGMTQYYLASAFDEIWMQPVGTLSLDGLQLEVPFVRGALDKIGVQPEFFQRKEYKSVFETFTNEQMSAESEEVMADLVNELTGIMLKDIAADRNISVQKLKSLVDKGLFYGEDAENSGLIDHVEYGDVLSKNIDKEANDAPYTRLSSYARVIKNRSNAAMPIAGAKDKGKIALVYVTGTIMEASSQSPEYLLSADNLVKHINKAKKDKDVKVMVVRVNSPGGTPTAAEKIRRTLKLVKDSGKPVVVSMGGMAASGGYWIAADADHIFALPTTLTGSIGVAGGKFVLQGLWEKLGVNWQQVDFGENAGYWSFNQPFSPTQRDHYNDLMDHMYDSFISLVAEGRDMSVAEVDKVARGRVWTGRQAAQNGLVDEIGGLNDALNFAAKLVGEKSRTNMSVEVYPKPRNVVEQLVELLQQQARVSGYLDVHSETFAEINQVVSPLVRKSQNPDMIIYQDLQEHMLR